ncbi:MAG: MoaD/ThiS family protein [Chloroflexi bacterium]|nr:MoaD/ThiS family protein [Chloroflexota bacterium]
MRVTAYPPFRKLLGGDTIEVDLPDGATVHDLLVALGAFDAGIGGLADAPTDEFLWQHLIVHVNDRIAGLRTPLRSADRIELLPTIAGG